MFWNKYIPEIYIRGINFFKNSVKERIKDYKVNGNWNLEDEFKSITKTNIYLPSAPIAPSRKSSPSNLKNMIIGAVVGGMIGVAVIYI